MDHGVVSHLRSLLRVMECSSLLEIQDEVDTWVDDFCVEVHGLGAFASNGIEVRVDARGTELEYPFSIEELRETVQELELVAEAGCAYEELGRQITEIEGIPVGVMVDYDVDPARVKPRHRRRQLGGGEIVQFPTDYPYRTLMSGSKTFGDWIADRFERHYPGLEAHLLPPDENLPPTTPLKDLRTM